MSSIELAPDVAYAVAGCLVRDFTVTRRNGRALPLWAPAVLAALAEASGEAACFAGETGSGSVVAVLSPGCLAACEAADLTGVSVQYVRRLASASRVRRERVGRTWLIDLDSLRTVLGRTRT